MEIKKERTGNELKVALVGRLDSTTFTDFDEATKEVTDGVEKLEINFAELEYISSAGLRVLLNLQKIMDKQGKMILINVNDEIKEIFDVTGFLDILTIE